MIKNVKIAVVEDNNSIRDLIVDTLMFSVNREVISFQDAISAWGYFDENNNTDIIISDVEMPGMNGLELLARVKTQYPKRYLLLCQQTRHMKKGKATGR